MELHQAATTLQRRFRERQQARQETTAATRIQSLFRGHRDRQQIAHDRATPVLVADLDDAVFGARAREMAASGVFEVHNVRRIGTSTTLVPQSDNAHRRLAPPQHTAVFLHGTARGTFTHRHRTLSANRATTLLRRMNLLPRGIGAGITSLACWSGADRNSRRRGPNVATAFGQRLANASRVPVVAPNGSLAIGGGGDLPIGQARVNLNMNDAGRTTSANTSLINIAQGQRNNGNQLQTERYRRPGAARAVGAWRGFQPI